MIVVALSAVILPLILLGIINMPATKGMSISAFIVLLEAISFGKCLQSLIGFYFSINS